MTSKQPMDGEYLRLKFDCQFKYNLREALGIRYVNCGEIDRKSAVGMALSCLYAPIYTAIEGGSLSEIEQQIAASRTQFEFYMMQALNRRVDGSDLVKSPPFNSHFLLSNGHGTSIEEKADVTNNNHDDDEILIDFNNEEL